MMRRNSGAGGALETELDEIFSVSDEQKLVDRVVLIETLKFMLRQVEYDDPELVSFVRTLIKPPSSSERLNLTRREKNQVDFSQMRQSEKVDVVLRQRKNGFFIEAGAYDGETYSNTLFFELTRNWTGLLIEPIPSIYRELMTKNRNAYSINACIANKRPSIEKFNVLHVLSGRDDQMSNDHRKRLRSEGLVDGKKYNSIAYIPCFPLETILKAINVNKIDYFSLDVEGGEMSIIESIDFNRTAIELFTIESSANHFHTETIRKRLEEHSYKLIENDYSELYFCKSSIL